MAAFLSLVSLLASLVAPVSSRQLSTLTISKTSISSVCSSTLYPTACINSLSSYPSSQNASLLHLTTFASKSALHNVAQALALAQSLSTTQPATYHAKSLENAALQDCRQLLDDANYHLTNTISSLSSFSDHTSLPKQKLNDMKIWLSTALTFQDTCNDGFTGLTGGITSQMKAKQDGVSQVVANALSLLCNLQAKTAIPGSRRRLLSKHFPSWLSPSDRKMLQSPSIAYNSIVAADGSAQYTSIKDAIARIPNKYSGRYVIYIKKGIYNEIVTISKALKSITLIGDGIGQTIITGNRNVANGGYTTFNTATVAISGEGFIARGITFRNTAGPSGHQAVAVRAGADHVAFDKCSFEGYQDTLYALSSRQFYRNCKIYGTVDFIFGNAAAVFQNCELLARKPMQGQQNTLTAQGRMVEDDPTGFSFQNCSVIAADDLKASSYKVSTYLGRPWKEYSRTVFLKSYMNSLVQPAGWLSWDASDPFEDTLYYGEYRNDGPGAGTAGRVSWKGVHSNMNYQEASVFSASSFISGTSWLPQANVDVDETLPH